MDRTAHDEGLVDSKGCLATVVLISGDGNDVGAQAAISLAK